VKSRHLRPDPAPRYHAPIEVNQGKRGLLISACFEAKTLTYFDAGASIALLCPATSHRWVSADPLLVEAPGSMAKAQRPAWRVIGARGFNMVQQKGHKRLQKATGIQALVTQVVKVLTRRYA
jgi:hypothetical protein